MLYKFSQDEFDFLKRFLDWDDLEMPYEIRPEKLEILIDDSEDENFMSLISDISVVYGMDDDQNRLTDIGQKALSIYDRLYFKVFE